jgi:hypothetical protein
MVGMCDIGIAESGADGRVTITDGLVIEVEGRLAPKRVLSEEYAELSL